MKIHTLANGATVLSLSPHPFRFSDGTVSEPQDKEVCDRFTLSRKESYIDKIKGMTLNETRFVLSLGQINELSLLAQHADIVLVPLPLLSAIRETEYRHQDEFRNVVAMNATKETQRAKPDEKIVDINNWSY